jgi:hypothetical protein
VASFLDEHAWRRSSLLPRRASAAEGPVSGGSGRTEPEAKPLSGTRKNHHFVPKFYFRMFSKDQKSICVLNRANGSAYFRAPLKNQASKNWFYGNDEAETVLGEIEGKSAAAFKCLIETQAPGDLDEETVTWLLAHITLQRARTQAARDAGQPLADKFTQLYMESAIGSTPDMRDEERELLLSAIPFISADPVQAQGLEMHVALENCASLSDLFPLLLVNKTNRPFIFGDAPSVFYNAYYRNVRLRGVLGFETPGLMAILPLGEQLCLMLLDASSYELRGARDNKVAVRDLRDVAALNALQLHAASDCVYFADPAHAAYVKSLWEAERMVLAPHLGTVIQAPAKDAVTGADRGEILHGFQPQLPYNLRLSFLKNPVLGDKDYRFSRRSGDSGGFN